MRHLKSAAGLLAMLVLMFASLSILLIKPVGVPLRKLPNFFLIVNLLKMFFLKLVFLLLLFLNLTITKWLGAVMVLRGFEMKDFYNGFSDYLRIFCGSYRCAWHWFAFHYFRNNTLRVLSYEH